MHIMLSKHKMSWAIMLYAWAHIYIRFSCMFIKKNAMDSALSHLNLGLQEWAAEKEMSLAKIP